MGFVIKKIVVHSEPTRVRGGEVHYNMVREKWDVRNLLEVRERVFCQIIPVSLTIQLTSFLLTSIIVYLTAVYLYYPCNPYNTCKTHLWPKVFSREYSHKDFCLAHLFTDLKFEGGILGLAYVGSPRRNSVGGICTPG